MDESLDLLFERYRRTGDPDLLAQVFDWTAPRLLRAAVHLTGDAASAEDLVQTTFVTAIERASTWDARRSLEGWLTGILGNKARETRKRESREIDVDRLARREAERPDDEAGERETSAALVQAIDELPEPYRQPLLLRLRHGLGPAEIAHVLGESPGAIRVRLHRGIEKLRKLLPAGIVASALFVARPARGLAAVREVVIAHAGSIPVALGAGSIVGGVLAVKKLLLAGVVLFLAVLALLGGSRLLRSEGRKGPVPEPVSVLIPERVDGAESESVQGIETTPAPSERVTASIGETSEEVLEGRVIDVQTREGIPGAIIDLYRPRRSRLSEVRRLWPDRVLQSGSGTFLHMDSWPWVPETLSDAQLGDLEDVLVLDAPLPDLKPIATVTSDAEGRFAIPKDSVPGFIVCRAESFATRFRPIHEADEPITIWMSRPWRLEGHVIDTEGRRVARSLRLAFTAWEPPPEILPKDGYPSVGMGTWITTTREDGSFEVEVAAPDVRVRSLEPGVLLVTGGKDPKGEGRWVFPTSFKPDWKPPAVLVARSPPVLLVRDAPTKEPIEDFRMITTIGGLDQYSGTGPMRAPGGRLMLLHFDPDAVPYLKSELSAAHLIQIWARGHLPAKVEVPNLTDAGEIVVDLERGTMPAIAGVVLRHGTPIEGATVSLIHLEFQWREEEDVGFLAATRTDTAGGFTLEAPEGTYLLRCTFADERRCRSVRIPSSAPIRIDFDRETMVEVRLRDESGPPRVNHKVDLLGDDNSVRSTHSDESGLAVFSHLAAGGYRVLVSYKTTEESYQADEVRRVPVEEGERAKVEIVFPDLAPRHPRLVVDGSAPGLGWRVRNRFRPGDAVVDVAVDGTIPIEIQMGVQELEVQGPDDRRWTFPIPKGSPDGFELRVELDGLSYEGSLARLNDGKSLANVFVSASLDTGGPVRPRSYRALTDSDGHFRISGLEPGRYRFRFERRDRAYIQPDGLEEMSFLPSDPPSEHPRPLAIRVPRRVGEKYEAISTCEISGIARVAGSPASDKTVSIESWIAVEGGSIVIWERTGMADTDAEGRFRVRVPCASRYSALLDSHDAQIRGPVAFDADPGAVSIEHDLDFP